jgi:hypothetical protein
MKNITALDIARDLLGDWEPHRRVDPERRLAILSKIVLDLMMELEALRETIASGSTYRDAYRKAALLTHNNAGPSDGWDKLLGLFYRFEESSGDGPWRETTMMQRLGFTPTEIELYQQEAKEAELYT